MTLTEFLLARIAEDAAIDEVFEGDDGSRTVVLANRQIHEQSCAINGAYDTYCSCDGAERWLAECEAKRRIVESVHVENPTYGDLSRTTCTNPYVLELLALPYADHPDYRDEWRP